MAPSSPKSALLGCPGSPSLGSNGLYDQGCYDVQNQDKLLSGGLLQQAQESNGSLQKFPGAKEKEA